MAALLSLGCAAAQAVTPGEPAPELVLPSTSDAVVHIDDYHGEVIYLDFWASWCAPCRKSFPWMNEIQKRYGDQGLRVVAVNLDNEAAAREAFLNRYPAEFTVLIDGAGETAQRFAVQGMPSAYLIDRRGVVREIHRGFRDDHEAKLEATIAELLAEGRS
ncbi:TlpA disulfide reductase family protein [Endothiovibrio diazotrophicus]